MIADPLDDTLEVPTSSTIHKRGYSSRSSFTDSSVSHDIHSAIGRDVLVNPIKNDNIDGMFNTGYLVLRRFLTMFFWFLKLFLSSYILFFYILDDLLLPTTNLVELGTRQHSKQDDKISWIQRILSSSDSKGLKETPIRTFVRKKVRSLFRMLK